MSAKQHSDDDGYGLLERMADVNWLTAAIFLLLPAIAIAARRSGGSWYSPAAFFAAFWCIFGGLPLIAGPLDVPPAGMLFIVAACTAVFLGAWAARRRWPATAGPVLTMNEPPLLGWFIAACTLLGIAVVVLILGSINVPGSANRDISFGGIVATIHQLAIARNAGTWQEPAVARVLTTAVYLGAMLSGSMIAMRNAGWARLLSLAVFLPSVAITVILTTKASLLVPIVLGASSYLATSLAAGRPPRLTLKRTVWLAGAIAVLAVAFVLIQMVRYAGWSSGQPLAVVRLLWLDSFPYLAVFSSWFQGNALSTSLHPALGQYTFAGVFDLLHIHTRVAGVYTEQVSIGGSTYNIYTAFRGLIEDFTVPGAVVFLALVGFGAELAYQRVRSGNLRYAGLLAAFYAATLWSFVVDLFTYNTIVLAYLILIGYLVLAARPTSKRALSPQVSA
jgi:oligosaccharide repeat unit polymerase